MGEQDLPARAQGGDYTLRQADPARDHCSVPHLKYVAKASVSGSARCGVPSLGARPAPRSLRSVARAAKELHFNGDGEALKRMQRGVERLASVVGVTLGPKGRNVVLESRFGSPRIVNDGVTVAREVELEDAVENVGAKLVRQAAAKTNDVAGDGTTTATILAAAMIAEGMKIVAAGVNPVQVVRGMERTVKHLVGQLATLSSPVTDAELRDVATVSAGGNEVIGALIAEAMSKVGREGVVSMEESKTAEDSLEIVEGMQFDRGFISPYFVTDPERGVAEYDDARLLLVDKKVASARELVGALEAAVRGAYPLVIVAEDVEQEALATLVVNKLRGALRVVAVKAPGFGERRTSYLEDLAVLTGGQVVSDALGTSLDKVGEEFLGRAARVTVSKDRITVVGRAGDAEVASAVAQRVASVRRAAEAADSDYEREKLQERVAKLAGGVALVRVGAQTETELKEKKLRVEDALNATKAAVEEGIVTGGGCTLLRLASYVAELRSQLANDEQRMGADVVARALSAPLKLIASNAGGNGSIVAERVAEHAADARYGYNAATGEYGDLLAAGIVDPAKVVRCALENASSVARTFLTSSVVVTEIPQPEPAMPQGGGGGEFGY